MPGDEGTVRISVSLSKEMYSVLLKIKEERMHKSLSETVRYVIAEYIAHLREARVGV